MATQYLLFAIIISSYSNKIYIFGHYANIYFYQLKHMMG